MKVNIKIAIYIFLITMIIVGCGKSKEQQIMEQMELGNRYLTEANYEAAIIAFHKVIHLEPKEVEAYTGLLIAFAETGELKKAEEIIEIGTELFLNEDIQDMNNSVNFIQGINEYYLRYKELEKKTEYWRKLSNCYPQSEVYQQQLEEVLIQLADYYMEEAEKCLDNRKENLALEWYQKAYDINHDVELKKRIFALKNGGKYEDEEGNIWNGYGLQKKVYYDSEGNLKFYTEFKYDENGEIIRIDEYDSTGQLKGYELRNQDGLRTYTSIFDAQGILTGKSIREVDKYGNWLYTASLDSDGNERSRRVAIYNEKGEYIGWDTYESGKLTSYVREEDQHTTYYDADGNIIMYTE